MLPTITFDDTTGKVIITSVAGTTIRYEFDSNTPTAGGTSYTSPTDPIDVSGHTAIKAIAVRTSDNKVSDVATMSLKAYTYHIINRTKTEAIRYTLTQPVGKSLTKTYTSIPAAIRSPYLEDETVRFFNNSACTDQYEITETPSTATGDIYVTYTNTHLNGKFLQLSGARPLNITINGVYVYDSGTAGSGTLAPNNEPNDSEKSSKAYLWYFSGQDPYAVEIKNVNTNNYLGYNTPSTLLLEGSLTKKFILMSGSADGDGSTYEQMELMAATGDANHYRVGYSGAAFNISTSAGTNDQQVCAYPSTTEVTYHLIDQAGKELVSITTKSAAVNLPNEWQSPLVSEYHYWKVGAFDTYDSGTTYKLKESPAESDIISDIMDATDIYVTYEVNDNVTFDISNDDKTHNELYSTYMLKFYGGESFNQENGVDGIETSPKKAEHPYSNGDAMLYIYDGDRQVDQFASGASTRPRWLWYVVSPKAATVKINEEDKPVTPGYKGDPYHVKIMSHSADVKSKDDPNNTKHQNFFHTYVVNYGGSNHVVTGLTTYYDDNSVAEPTEYMVLKAPNDRCKLVTVNEIPLDINGDGDYDDEGEGTERRTVNTFEQYWKNNPTVQNKLGNAKVTESESATDNITLTPQQEAVLPYNWHTYKIWAQAAPWVKWSEDGKTGKQYKNKNHWFQTIDMGNTGEFTFEATTLEPEVILLDQHGWEIMRAPLSKAEMLRKYDSPMVQEYQWYPSAAKVTGYHKYKVSDPEIIVYQSYVDAAGKTKWQDSGNKYTHTSTSLADSPYDHFKEHGWEVQDKSVKTDFYVTYTVKPEYANLYKGAATATGVTPSAYMVKQGTEYAKINDSNELEPTTEDPTKSASIEEDVEWYVKPNFDIDVEMGYKYDVEEDDGAGGTFTPNKAQKDALNYAEGRNGFDPYNVQIQSVKNSYYYFKTLTTDSHVTNAWEGTSTSTGLSLKEMNDENSRQEDVEGLNQTSLSITNATFMVVKDASGHMLLMPRFDNTVVVNSFSGTQLTAPDAATQTLELIMAPKVIHSTDELQSLNGQYTLAPDFTFKDDFTSLGSSGSPFTGSIDGGLHKLTGLSMPLIAYANGAIIKNIILDNVTIGNAEDVPNVGAIVANALGETRIYNCGILSGSVGGGNTDDVGGIVGSLDGSAHVINCYSYATITGGDNVGGIVGNNKGTTTATSITTMVMNCMFYGDITGGKTKSPVFGGNNIGNLQGGGLNTFNYYAYTQLPTGHITAGKYNSALAVEDKYLNRFEFYRLLLNSNKKLAAFYASSTTRTANANDMMKWVLETADKSISEPKPYPVLKQRFEDDGTIARYPSIINYDVPEDLDDYTEANRNQGLKTGTLSVTISESNTTTGGQTKPTGATVETTSLTLTRTDKDFEHFNYNYDKVQLPYYNDVGTGNYTGNKVVTGWKITSMSPMPASDPYTSDNYPSSGIKDYPDHNYADRKSANKDLYGVSGRVFSQGAYFDVPYGVTSITIEPYWGNAIYVADEFYDVVYKNDYSGKQGVSQTGTQATKFNDQSVKTSITGLGSGTTVYDNAVVLVGNFHLDGVPSNGTTPFTMMSVDEDNDHEPDYSLIYHHKKRLNICPIRFDFLDVIGTAQAQKPNGASLICNFTICKTRGWFEVTNTALIYSSQFEYENLGTGDGNNNTGKVDAPLILLGGVFDQFVSTQSSAVNGKVYYIHVGGNVWIKEFGMGTHSDGSQSTPHVPVSVTGGEFPGFYLTGTYKADAIVRTDNAECYISGGYFHEVAGASLEQINGNVHWQIYNADIDNFFGGGINDAKPIKGDITTDIYNSHVTLFCGGPKFGNMTLDPKNPDNNKKVTTNAEGCTFGKFFGAGYGGVSLAKKKYYDKDGGQNWATLQGYYTTDRGKYFNGTKTELKQGSTSYGFKGPGVATDFDYEFFVWSSGATGARLYVKFASFSLAQCNDVTSNLTNCTINQDFYDGGNLGSVVGTAKSTLDGCTVHGSVFGGGYSATLPTIEVRDAGFTTDPNYNSASGMFEPGVFSGTTTYDWKHVAPLPSDGSAGFVTEDGKNYVKTDVDLTALGQVANTNLTVKGNTLVEGNIFNADGSVKETTGGVFGGGDMSAVNHNTEVKIQGTAEGGVLNVFGGGNTADVLENTTVMITGGTIGSSADASDTNGNVYGGGKGQTTIVKGDVKVTIGAKEGSTLSGSGHIQSNVYGGSALGAVNATKAATTGALSYTEGKNTEVFVYGGTVDGSVFGGGLGRLAKSAVGNVEEEGYVPAVSAIAAQNFGPTSVTMEGGTVGAAVYGGANENGVLDKTSTVTISGGTVGTAPTEEKPDITDVVFGGGYGQPTEVNGNVTVNIGTSGQNTGNATYYGNIYGGGALGSVHGNTEVNLNYGVINGNVYGGGLGRQYKAGSEAVGTVGQDDYVAAVPEVPAVAAIVGGNSTVTLNGATLKTKYTTGETPTLLTGQIFGCNNLNGSPSGHVKVHVKKTIPVDGQSYDVAAVYGGGNEADYNASADDFAEVIIEGCELTSIKDVYGGGNAAAVPATEVWILGTKIIENVFGGGNGELGADHAAHVGFKRGADLSKTDYTSGTGKALVKLVGGTITNVYGGSNSNGDIRGGAEISQPQKTAYPGYEEGVTSCCNTLKATNIYGGGKNADMSGGTNIVLGCMPNDWIEDIYAGAQNADVDGNVSLTITSGKFKRVFGGNKDGGLLKGSITVNIEESGDDCGTPIIIGDLYGGGNLAAYSIYGYYNSGTDESPVWVPRTKAQYNALTVEEQAANPKYPNPQLNVRSFTSIGNIFGGGYKAKMIADPHVDIDVVKGSHYNDDNLTAGTVDVVISESETLHLSYPAHEKGKIGAIGNVFGGGNLAEVDGSATVNIGTEAKAKFITEPTHLGTKGTDYTQTSDGKYEASVEGADIKGSVYGGGQNGVVTGDTQVNICAEEVTVDENKVWQSVATVAEHVKIAENVFGAGLGLTTAVNNATIHIGGGAVGKSVYGGGEKGVVNGDTHIYLIDGEIGDKNNIHGGATIGNIYGGGMGTILDAEAATELEKINSGLVKGNTNINISGGSIYHNIYGGGAYGSVGTFTYDTDGSNAIPDGTPVNCAANTGTANIIITGGTIGTDGHENGMVFGSSRGDVGTPRSINDYLAWVDFANVVIGTTNDATDGPHIKGSLYGSGENGHTLHNASVTIHSGMVGITETMASDPEGQGGAKYPYRGNVYGGGCGTDKYDNNTKYNPLSGIVHGTATVVINGGHVVRNLYGAGAMGSVDGLTTVTINGGIIGAENSGGGYVYAAARGDDTLDDAHQAYAGSTELNINGGTVWGDAFGGGQAGIAKGAVTVNLTGGEVKQDVYGGGALAKTNITAISGGVYPATNVTLGGTTITGNLYGGGLGRLAVAGVAAVYTAVANGTTLTSGNTYYTSNTGAGEFKSDGTEVADGTNYFEITTPGTAAISAVEADVNGPVTVAVTAGSATNVFGCNNLNGKPKSTVEVEIGAKSGSTLSGSAIISGSVYGGGNQAAYTGNTSVKLYGGTVNTNVYGGGLGSTAVVTGNTAITMEGGTVKNDVYGGGSQADVTGSVDVTISGGVVTNDVYGGGALANTNTANWDTSADNWTDTSTGTFYAVVKHLKRYNPNKNGAGVYDPDEYAAASAVGSYYVRSGEAPNYSYTITSDEKAKDGVTYYKEITGLNVAANGTTYKTTVSLTGGTIGNAYGGGLGKYTADGEPTGEGAVAAMVYGDVAVTVDGTKFTQESARVDGKAIPTTGRVFGCNNKNGTPKGSVNVCVKQTKRLDGGSHVKNQFEIQGVYGGGNMANYVPQTYDASTEFGQSTHVLIEGCDKTSIERVYGGGNASNVPYTDVVIEGSFQIGYVFGGGNGGDKITKDDGNTWIENPGASVSIYSNVLLQGGTIGEAFGGSDSKGTVVNADLRTQPSGFCDLVINNIYGASKEADFDGDVLLELSRCSGEVDKVFGGSYNANVRGSVTINIKSGIYTSVYGGNDRKGSIGGNININVEEVDQCNPIIIQNLFGGGSQADYPGAGAQYITNAKDESGHYTGAGVTYDSGTGKYTGLTYADFESGNITINIKSATRIDRVFGGCDNAKATGNTTVNINMVKGSMAGNGFTVPATYTGNPIPNIHTSDAYAVVSGLSVGDDVTGKYTRSGNTYTQIVSGTAVAGTTYYEYLTGISTIDDAIGTIGSVYGGGNQGDVDGSTTVNIGAQKDITFVHTPDHLTPNGSGKYDVLGATITGDVFGGGNEGEVSGNTTVNISTADFSTPPVDFQGVSISDGSVYGGGSEADVLGNTNVTMAGGYVFDGVYGGGLKGSVGTAAKDGEGNPLSGAIIYHTGNEAHAGCIGKIVNYQANTGKCTVVISGGQVGPKEAAASDGGMLNTKRYFKDPDDTNDVGPVDVGFVFGAGRGEVENPAEEPDADFHTYVRETDVTISGGLIMASVYGGGENGRVRGDTHVKITGGQIGCGKLDDSGNPVIYDDADFINPATASASTIETKAGDMPECSYWTYGKDTDGDGIKDEFVPFDPYADVFPGKYGKASTETPTDGKTYYGSVFGGGSGYFPYEIKNSAGTVVNYEWLRSAGWVEGNTVVDITGGHILNNIYGGNEYTDVGTAGNASTGKCTVNFGGKATLGVPRTLAEIADHPVSCYLFGAGKGDQRAHFNTWTNVNSVEVNVTGGIIYGSVFGGGEDGHVLGDTKVTISDDTSEEGHINTTIGTWGTSYVDGNVFGGGRGFTGEALTAGNVGGSVDLDITGGTILGSIYGGGRLGSVGYGLYASTETGKYGVLQDDGKFDDGTDGSSFYTHGRGNIDISITGGTIGNAYEYKYYEIEVDKSGKTTAQIAAARTSALETQKATDYIPYTDFELADSAQVGETTTWKYIYRLKHTKGGNVFAGGMGRLYKLDGKTPQSGWKELGKVKKTTLAISGADTKIRGNVYGGGELGFVSEIHENVNNTNVLTDINITNGTIGTVVKDDSDNDKYTFGSVYGGGYGSTLEKIDPTKEDIPLNDIDNPKFISGRVHGSTRIRMEDGTVLASIYGGGEVANVRGSSNIAISGGTVGKDKVGASAPYTYFGGATMGNVYGGGNGNRSIVRCGQVFGNATISISQAEGKTTRIYHNVYGGGAYGSVGDIDWIEEKDPIFNSYKVKDVNGIKTEGTGKATIIITGGTIGSDGHENGMVFGSSRGDVIDPGVRDDWMAFTYDTDVTIGTSGSGTTLTTPLIKGSVYGSGENGHVWHNTDVKVHSGTIGVPTEYYAYRGNVYGAGCGTDQYDSNGDGTLDAYRKTAGIVNGNALVTIDGGQVARNVYGAGAMGSVLGNTSVTVTGNAVIGSDVDGSSEDGNVYGAARGEVGFTNALATFADFAYVSNSSVTISGGTVKSSVYGGGEAGIVKGKVTVTMTGGTVAQNVYGGGALADSNTSNVSSDGIIGETDVNTTTVNLKGGTIAHDAFGGALGRVGDSPIEPKVFGNITVELNKDVATTAKGCILERIFGCNDLNGTPKGHVKVHVHATQNSSASKATINDKFEKRPANKKTGDVLKTKLQEYIDATKSGEGYVDSKIDETVITRAQTTCNNSATDEQLNTAINDVLEELCKLYDVKAVYGGGNLAPYMPRGQNPKAANDDWKNTLETTEVIIEGCDLTSIRQVYAGGNAASTPATNVQVNSAYEIDELFGGGNGNDAYEKAGKWYENPGANVGYTNYISHSTTTEGKDGSTKEKAYPIGKEEETLTKSDKTGYRYGRGYAVTNASGGRIHAVYGGSNQRGNISTMAMSAYQSSSSCTLNTDETYGAGKNAKLDGEVNVSFDCVTDGGTIYGGAKDAHLESGVTLNITNGIYNDIYGGNNESGTIRGPITINIRENGCMPIIIKGGVYAGGYKAGYSVYGYKNDNTARTKSEYEALSAADKENIEVYRDPRINVISATKIGAIFGGGFQGLLVGNPHINVNMEKGRVLAEYANKAGDESKFTVDTHTTTDGETYTVESHETGKDAILAIGTIGNIYGGGNDANVDGNTYVEIGTGQWLNNEGAYEREGTDGVTYTYKNGNWTYIDGAQEKVATTTPTPKRNKAFITGSVYGGGNLADVTNNTYVTMGNGEVATAIYGGGNLGNVGTLTPVSGADLGNYTWATGTGSSNVTITGGTVGPTTPTEAIPGNVFGGGKGNDGSFYCEKGMVYSTNVNIENGTVKGNVYGGGEIARVEQNTAVTIGLATGTSEPLIEGDVFGAGKGLSTHGYSALVRGNPTVIVQGDAKLKKSVYGGGQIASVGSFWVNTPNLPADAPTPPAGTPIGMPYQMKVEDSGTCTVIVRGNAEIGPDNMTMTNPKGPDDTGYIFGAGKGFLPLEYTYADDAHRPKRMVNSNGDNIWSYFEKESDYISYIETLALTGATKVTVGGNAFVKGSVYGGSENGYVLNDTEVTIADNCQIGNGYVQMADDGTALVTQRGVNRRYTDAEWAAGHLFVEGDPDIDATDATESALRTAVGTNYKTSLPECASWPYGENTGTPESPVMRYLAYDVYDYIDPSAEKPVPKYASDGHTFYGNVFGGGSGYYPYRRKSGWVKDATKSAAVGQPVDKDGYSDGVWHRAAGAVYGNTTVEITGGHILSNVYGGNEMTDVGKFTNDVNGEPTIPDTAGLCTVKMSGGTLGVPRTLKQIAAHPVTCYLFGAGKGDQRINFNTWTNVNDAVVEVSNEARIYGSVFGGGEDGHVLRDTKVDIKTGKDVTIGTATTRYPYIGTTGTSYVDGNIFGGGRGFSGEALTAGSVGGNVSLNISDGTILGSVYGGGRLASVGTGFRAVTDPHYGQLQADYDTNVTFTSEEISAAKEGDAAYGKTTSDIKAYAGSHGHVTVNISGGTIGNDLEDITVKHTKGGNVFGGSMGRLTLLDGSISPIWPKSAIVKSSKINISGNSLIKGNVYGGSELGMLRGDVYVTIGGVLGDDNTITSTDSDNPTIMRDVYGGGYGSDDYETMTTITAGGFTHATYTFTPMQLAGIVCGDTYINMKRGHVQKNLYGGGEMATVGLVDFTHAEKHEDVTKSFALSWPYKMSFIPYDDSGISSAIGGSTNINITGGRLGLTGKDFMGPFNAAGKAISATDRHPLTDDEEKAARLDNGDVYGGGKGLAGDRHDYAFCANVKETHVTINYPANNGATPANYKDKSGNAYTHDCVAGAVYGGGENGHVIEDTEVKLTNGLIGHALYGGGSGKGKYTTSITRIDDGTSKDVSIYSITAGKVYGNTNVEMTNGYVVRNIYGGGNMGSVGKGNYAGGPDDYSTIGYGEMPTGNLWTTKFNSEAAESESNKKDDAWQFLNSGKTVVKVTGGQVGYIDPEDPSESFKDDMVYGNIFGGCRGESAPNIGHSPRYQYSPEFFSGYINESEVIIGEAAVGTIGTDGYVAASGPKILGSVYGGGQDGHVRRDTHVTVYGGEIGIAYNNDNRTKVGTNTLTLEEELNNPQWLQRGNVYGAGSGIGKYEYDFNYNGVHYDNNGNLEKYDYTNPQNNKTSEMKEIDYSTSAGSVTRFTQVDILGGTIHRNVYGGGSQSSIGAPKIPVNGVMPADPDKKDLSESGIANQGKQSQCTVNIGGGTSKVTIGTEDDYKEHYGGEVYGASRGNPSLDATQFGTTIWTEVNVFENVKIMGNVFGGGDAGMVKKDAKVTIGGNPVTP